MSSPASSNPTELQDHDPAAIIALAQRHGIKLCSDGDSSDIDIDININELGLDFRVATVKDQSGVNWVLRIPRRADVLPKIERESQILSLLKPRLPFAVPDWQITTAELVAYPRLNDFTAIEVKMPEQEITWHINQESDAFVESLGKSLAALHAISIDDSAAAGLKVSTSQQVREQIRRNIEQVKTAFEIDPSLENRWQAWLQNDALWPDHSTVVHGDLYVGHILVNAQDEVTGMIDWTEAEVSDPSIDFTSHLMLFGEDGLAKLIHHYEAAGGKVWPNMAAHIAERLSQAPIRYALFALESGDPIHMEAVKAQLMPDKVDLE